MRRRKRSVRIDVQELVDVILIEIEEAKEKYHSNDMGEVLIARGKVKGLETVLETIALMTGLDLD